jgi:hypothetical protein
MTESASRPAAQGADRTAGELAGGEAASSLALSLSKGAPPWRGGVPPPDHRTPVARHLSSRPSIADRAAFAVTPIAPSRITPAKISADR